MIEFALTIGRSKRFHQLSELVEPDRYVKEIIDLSGRLIIPVTHAQHLYDWLRVGHARIGIGFHDVLWQAERLLDKSLYSLRTHPAMNGYGMLGHRNTAPLSCWNHETVRDISYCNIDGFGTEGFLVPQDARFDGSKDHYTFWTFVKEPHGLPRDRQSMFIPLFKNRGRNEKNSFEAKAALDRKARLGF